ncbi:TolC family protein [Mucilaginibacter sabulilitoris]|uniref:TolC family protein n=1 Tax=Mucilaginibacter sabulilitoris TaxID=1173583 RepID=A0ABZ0TT01_9SPHI|nr:TolC family protein [Mucilaginibacter sabulilitoris]WPU96240.1 TolC family protein [Mucilaginibacter sabulilitoris]
MMKRLATYAKRVNYRRHNFAANMYSKILIAFVALLAVNNAYSQLKETPPLTLTEAWRKAEENSRQIEITRKTSSIANEEIKDARMERLPDIGLLGSIEKATNMPIYENGLFSAHTQEHEIIHTLYKAGADFYLNLYNGNKLNLKIEENKLLYQITVIQNHDAISAIRYKTATLYLDLQKTMIFRKLIIKDIADQEKQLLEIKALQKNGVVLKSDVLRVELDLSRRKMALVTIENDILIATQKLNIIMGEPDDRMIVPTESDQVDQPGLSYENYLSEAMEHSFSYHISEKKTEVSKVRLNQVKANYKPKVGLYSDFSYANPQIFLFPYNPAWYSLGVAGIRVTMPLSQLYQNTHKVSAAKLEMEKEEITHKDTEDKVRQGVRAAYLRYKESLVQIDVAEVNVAHAQENARIIKNTYFNQTSLITDLLDADVQVLQTRFELAAARLMAQNKYYLLQNITGVL